MKWFCIGILGWFFWTLVLWLFGGITIYRFRRRKNWIPEEELKRRDLERQRADMQ